MFALDTDTLSLLFKGQERVAAAARRAAGPIVVPPVVRIESLLGRFDAVTKAANAAELLRAVELLARTEYALAKFTVLPINPAAADHFERLRLMTGLRKIGRGDSLIACIALAHDATLVTRNTKDFRLVPGLKLENWAD